MTDSKTSGGWDPGLYHRFADQRSQPFYDLMGLCQPLPDGGLAVDLGCGTGSLTALLHDRIGAAATTGIDNSPAMLESALGLDVPGLGFAEGDIGEFGRPAMGGPSFDLVFSNAALHWVPEPHPDVLARWASALRPGGQLAVQVPSNADHLSHLTAARVATEEPFFSLFGGSPPVDPVIGVLPPAAYAELLYDLGFTVQHVRLQVYGHILQSTRSVVEWVSGTSLTRFRSRLSPEDYERFLRRYTDALVGEIGDREPYFYAFKRILLWGRLAD